MKKIDLKAYIEERNQVLLTGGPSDLMAFMMKHDMPLPTGQHSLEMTFHKTITGIASLPLEHRKKSKAWLVEHGYHSLDDGELG